MGAMCSGKSKNPTNILENPKANKPEANKKNVTFSETNKVHILPSPDSINASESGPPVVIIKSSKPLASSKNPVVHEPLIVSVDEVEVKVTSDEN